MCAVGGRRALTLLLDDARACRQAVLRRCGSRSGGGRLRRLLLLAPGLLLRRLVAARDVGDGDVSDAVGARVACRPPLLFVLVQDLQLVSLSRMRR